jgi:hypothetical protein
MGGDWVAGRIIREQSCRADVILHNSNAEREQSMLERFIISR